MNFHHTKRRILVTGASGTGKTTLGIRLVQQSRAKWVFYFDPEQEFAHKLKIPPSFTPQQMNERAAKALPVCYVPDYMFPHDLDAAFKFFCGWVLMFCRLTNPKTGRFIINGPKMIVVDEIEGFTTTGQNGIPPEFLEITNQGRRLEIDSVLLSQGPNGVNDKVRRQLTEIYTLRHEDPLVLHWLEKHFGFPPDKVTKLKIPGGFLVKKRFCVNPNSENPSGAGKGRNAKSGV